MEMKRNLSCVLMIILLVGGSSVSLGAGLHLDGSDKFVSIPFYPNLQLENGDFTWITFIRTDGVGGTPGEDFMVLGNREDSVYQGTNYCRLLISRQTGVAYMRYGGSSEEDLVGVTDLRDNEWHQLALVRSGNTLELYVDGQLDSQETFSQLPVVSTSYGHRLGAAINPGGDAFRYPFVGDIDEVSMWSSALNETEIHGYFMNAPTPGDDGIEAYWAFDEDSGQFVFDQVNGNNGFLGLTDGADSHDPLRSDGYNYGGDGGELPIDDHTQVLYHFEDDPGMIAYDATDNHYDLNLSGGAAFTPDGLYGAALDMTESLAWTENLDEVGNEWDALSIEASVYPLEIVGAWRPVVYRADTGNSMDPSYFLRIDENGALHGAVYLGYLGTDFLEVTSAPGLVSTEEWTSLMLTWERNNLLRLFVDGELVAASTGYPDRAIRNGNDPLGIGCVNSWFDTPHRFHGYIDEVRISDIDRSGILPPPDGPVTLTLMPSNTTIPPGGGTLTYAVHLISTLPDQFNNVYYWTNLILPDGSEYPQGGWLMSQHVILRPFMDVTQTGFTQNIPLFADPGEYEFQAHFGYMSGMYVSDSFTFTKLSGTSNGNEVFDWNSGGDFGLDSPDLDEALPVEWAVSAATPNPFNPSTTIRVALPEAAELKVTVTNILGQRVALLTDGMQVAGKHTLIFDAQGLASGLYFLHAHVPGHLNQVQKVMLVR